MKVYGIKITDLDEHCFRWLQAERDFGAIIRGTEPEVLRSDYAQARLAELRREFERRS